MRATLCLALLLAGLPLRAQPAPPLIPVHDPVLSRQNGTYTCSARGRASPSGHRKTGSTGPAKSPCLPARQLGPRGPGFRDNHIWAPDISLHDGRYYLFYSVSTFGKNTSCIGLATNNTLDPAAPGFKWEDHGRVIQSVPSRDLWNAIDPNLIRDEAGRPWLTFGSFWGGIKLVQLRPDLTAPAQPEQWRTLARRPRDPRLNDSLPGDGAVEGPFIFRKGGYSSSPCPPARPRWRR